MRASRCRGDAIPAPLVERVAAGAPDAAAILAHAVWVRAPRMAVRSSAIGDDSEGPIFAGQHATVLNVAAPDLADAVREVLGVCEVTRRARRRRRGMTAPPSLGVVIQELIEPIAAGVCSPAIRSTGANERLIEAAWGLGEAVVSGLVIPDRYRLDASGGVLEIEPGTRT